MGGRPERTHPPGARRPARPTGLARAPRRVAGGPGVGRVLASPATGCSPWNGPAARPSSPSSCGRRSTPPTPARVVLDPSGRAADAAVAIDWYHPSPDGGLVAYGTSEGGDERSTLRLIDVDTGEHRAGRDPRHPGRLGRLAARRQRVPLHPLPGGRRVPPHGVRPHPRRRLARRPAGVGRPADARELARRQRVARRPVGRGPRARRVGPGRRAPPRPLERCVAHAGRRARRHHPPRLRRRPPGRHHDVGRAAGPGGGRRPRRSRRRVADARARGRRRRRELPAGGRRRCSSRPAGAPSATSTATPPTARPLGEVALPELGSLAGFDAEAHRAMAFLQLESFTRPGALFRWTPDEGLAAVGDGATTTRVTPPPCDPSVRSPCARCATRRSTAPRSGCSSCTAPTSCPAPTRPPS